MTLSFPTVIDSTALAAWRQCPTMAKWQCLYGIRPSAQSIDVVAGAAFARGLEAARRAFYAEGQDKETAEAIGIGQLIQAYGDPPATKDTPKTWDRMAGALEAYFHQYPFDRDNIQPACYSGKWAIEFSFAVPLDEWGLRHPDTGDPLLLAGRADMIGTFRNSDFVVDEKTTTQLGPTWGRKWDMRAQFLCYVWAAQRYGFDVAGVIVRGIAIRKEGYDFAEALLRRDDRLVGLWERQTQRTIREMLTAYTLCTREGRDPADPEVFGYNLGDACIAYGGCPYKDLCQTEDPEPHIKLDYTTDLWNPLTRKEPTPCHAK